MWGNREMKASVARRGYVRMRGRGVPVCSDEHENMNTCVKFLSTVIFAEGPKKKKKKKQRKH